MSQAFEEALVAYRDGQKALAQSLLAQALKANPRDEQAWLLLEQCVEQKERKKYCLQQVLLISPQNKVARQRLAELDSPAVQPSEPPPPLPPARGPTPPVATRVVTKPHSQLSGEPAPDALARGRQAASAPQSIAGSPNDALTSSEQPAPPLQTFTWTRDDAAASGEQAAPPPHTITGLGVDAPTGEQAAPPPPTILPVEPAVVSDTIQPETKPLVSGLEAALMDAESFQPGPFVTGAVSIVVEMSEDNQLAEIPEEPTFATIAPELESAAPVPAEDAVTSPGIARNIDKNGIRTRLEQAVTNLEHGSKSEGITQLEGILADDPRNEMAWMWLGAAVDDDARKRECYLHALEINPRSKMARDFLKAVEAKLGPAPAAEGAQVPTASPEAQPPGTGRPPIGMVLTALVVFVIVAGLVIWLILNR